MKVHPIMGKKNSLFKQKKMKKTSALNIFSKISSCVKNKRKKKQKK